MASHPEIRGLVGRNPWTAVILAAVLVLQIAIAWSMGQVGIGKWWLALILAYMIGAVANHCLYVIIHDATHNLIFRRRDLNKVAAIAADLPNLLPGAMGFGIYHLKHHAHQGEYDADADLPSHWEARLVRNRWYLKMAWLLCYPLVQALRPTRLASIRYADAWFAANCAAAIVFDVIIASLCGVNGLLYLFASFVFAIGLHPLGGRWIQEHYTIDPSQETMSYYGPLNIVALNVGYHNEHHDFPSVSWNRLPKVRACAPEFYDNLTYHTSLTRLLIRFIFDPSYSLYSRVERTSGKLAREPDMRVVAQGG